jgi:hypothetical protein
VRTRAAETGSSRIGFATAQAASANLSLAVGTWEGRETARTATYLSGKVANRKESVTEQQGRDSEVRAVERLLERSLKDGDDGTPKVHLGKTSSPVPARP